MKLIQFSCFHFDPSWTQETLHLFIWLRGFQVGSLEVDGIAFKKNLDLVGWNRPKLFTEMRLGRHKWGLLNWVPLYSEATLELKPCVNHWLLQRIRNCWKGSVFMFVNFWSFIFSFTWIMMHSQGFTIACFDNRTLFNVTSRNWSWIWREAYFCVYELLKLHITAPTLLQCWKLYIALKWVFFSRGD